MSTIGNVTSRTLNTVRFESTFNLIKRGAGTYVNGIYQAGAEQDIVVTGNHQPADLDLRNNFPDGERIVEVKWVFIKTDDKNLVRPMRQGPTNTPGDILRINGLDYEAYQVNNHALNQHLEILAVRQEDQSD